MSQTTTAKWWAADASKYCCCKSAVLQELHGWNSSSQYKISVERAVILPMQYNSRAPGLKHPNRSSREHAIYTNYSLTTPFNAHKLLTATCAASPRKRCCRFAGPLFFYLISYLLQKSALPHAPALETILKDVERLRVTLFVDDPRTSTDGMFSALVQRNSATHRFAWRSSHCI